MAEQEHLEKEMTLSAFLSDFSDEDWDSQDTDLQNPCLASEDEESSLDACGTYLGEDVLLTHLRRQGKILAESLQHRWNVPVTAAELSRTYERNLFCPPHPPNTDSSGVIDKNPRLNFYPCFLLPETLAAYHIFFSNLRIPLSCKANRANADTDLTLRDGAVIPRYETIEEVGRIFEGLGSERVSENALQDNNSALVELHNESPRLAVLKRCVRVSHFAYPALTLPPKIMKTIMACLVSKPCQPHLSPDTVTPNEGSSVVSDAELSRWLDSSNPDTLQQQRKRVTACVIVSLQLEAMERFFTNQTVIRKIGEALHYAFARGYVKLASDTAHVNLGNLVTYMGLLHENRLGQNTLHLTLDGTQQRDYIRDSIFLFLIYTWQTAMGAWQQCLQDANVQCLGDILTRQLQSLWCASSERACAKALCDIAVPKLLFDALITGLPDLASQSLLQNFRNFILERSGLLPAMCCALPTDFVPLYFRESPPTLWPYVYLLQLANFFMHQFDLKDVTESDGLLAAYCRCNLCSPHRCLATNPALLNESQLIGAFELQYPTDSGKSKSALKLTAGAWCSALLRKFHAEDFYPHKIHFYEDHPRANRTDLSACVITDAAILYELQAIKKAREEFLLKKGHGVYLDPDTGEELNVALSTDIHNVSDKSVASHQRDRGNVQRHHGQRRGRAGHNSSAESECRAESPPAQTVNTEQLSMSSGSQPQPENEQRRSSHSPEKPPRCRSTSHSRTL